MISKYWRRYLAFGFLLTFSLTPSAVGGPALTLLASQDQTEGQHGRNSLTLTSTEQPVVLDGRLDEESWNKAHVIENFLQRDPEVRRLNLG